MPKASEPAVLKWSYAWFESTGEDASHFQIDIDLGTGDKSGPQPQHLTYERVSYVNKAQMDARDHNRYLSAHMAQLCEQSERA
jgi:hypothetical protein